MSTFDKAIRALRAAAPALILALAAGCTVKEDRVPCPCVLHVSLAGGDSPASLVGLSAWGPAAEEFRAEVDLAMYDPSWDRAVHKGLYTLTAWESGARVSGAGHHVIIPVGAEADSLYACHIPVDATGEEAWAEVSLRKQFATVTVHLRRTPDQMAASTFVVEGNTCGFDLMDFSPIAGTFRHEPRPAPGQGSVSFRVPRQADNSLTLRAIVPGVDLGDIPIGEYIARMGYDWSEESLKDITVIIDLVIGGVMITVNDWEEGAWFDLVTL